MPWDLQDAFDELCGNPQWFLSKFIVRVSSASENLGLCKMYFGFAATSDPTNNLYSFWISNVERGIYHGTPIEVEVNFFPMQTPDHIPFVVWGSWLPESAGKTILSVTTELNACTLLYTCRPGNVMQVAHLKPCGGIDGVAFEGKLRDQAIIVPAEGATRCYGPLEFEQLRGFNATIIGVSSNGRKRLFAQTSQLQASEGPPRCVELGSN